MHFAAARAGAAGSTGHGTAGRHQFSDAAGRCEAYNHLNMKLLGVLQLLYKWVAWTQLGDVDQTARRETAF